MGIKRGVSGRFPFQAGVGLLFPLASVLKGASFGS